MKKSEDNRGFTLMELIVGILIMSIVMLAATGLISTAVNSYRVANIEIELQMEAQTAMNQLSDILIEAVSYRIEQKNDFVNADGNYEEVTELNVQTGDRMYLFRLHKRDKKLMVQSWDKGGVPEEEAFLARYCDSISVTPSSRPRAEEKQLVEVNLTFNYAEKTYTTTSCISLRGKGENEP